MSGVRLLCTSMLIALWSVRALAQDPGSHKEDLTPCSGSGPQPTQSGLWPVAFCNRTGHDIVIEFRDNDCPIEHWSHRGDIYRRSLRRGASATFSLCYVNQTHDSQTLSPGTPVVRIPGGKGVVTSWSVVGDCGPRSDQLNLDARTFYDRGDYPAGIILLQYPGGAAHCLGTAGASDEVPEAARPSLATAPTLRAAPAVVAGGTPPSQGESSSSAASSPSGSTAASPSSVAKASGASASAPTSTPEGRVAAGPSGIPPALRAQVDPKDPVSHSVQVFATNNAGEPAYRCNFMLALNFTDGGNYVDRIKAAEVASDVHDSMIVTRKYLKSVSTVTLTALRCSPP